MRLKYFFIIALMAFIFILPQICFSIEGQETTNKIVPDVNSYLIERNESKIFSTVVIGNEIYAYDVQLAMTLKEAGIEFSLKDLVDYSNTTDIPLLVKYEKPVYTGFFLIPAAMSDLTGIPFVRTSKIIVNDIKSAASMAKGEFKTGYKYMSYVAVDSSKDKLKEFASRLPSEVKKVYMDSIADIMLNESVPIINNPEKQEEIENKYGKLNGSGIKIAIIDTGVDKSHPDLNDLDDDPTTNDPKVIAEYDFAYEDSIADDKFGHGTHCAGIAAGTGEASNYKYVGVAPQAQLLSAKVLNDYGYGYFSDIIRGIEWAIENDADIISMSLGCGPDCRNQPLEDAIREAVNKGVAVAIAAGNYGGWSSISTPGVVEEAITVGASDKNDALAYFSSRGPTDDFLVKPDVVAPGVDICAASASDSSLSYREGCGNSYYISLSGTSMATPHVAGSVALILQAHPKWSPSMVKSSLVGTAKDMGLSVYEQGGGRIDTYDAIESSIIINPSVVSMGDVNLDENVDSKFSIKNIGENKYGIRIVTESLVNVKKSTDYETDWQFSNNDFCLNPNTENEISFSIDTSSLPLGYYSEYLKIYAFPNCDFDSLESIYGLPVGFSLFKNLTIKFDSPLWFSFDETKYYGVYFIENATGRMFYYDWFETELTKEYYVENEYFDAITNFITYEYGEKWRISYIAKKVDLRNTNSLTIGFNDEEAENLKTNIKDVIASRNMNAYSVESDFVISPYSYLGWVCIDTDSYPTLSKEWYVATNTKDAANDFYKIYLSSEGKENGKSFADSEEIIILPVNFSHPFNQEQNVYEAELRKVNITHYDSAKYIGSAEEDDNIYAWSLCPYSTEMRFFFGFLLNSNTPPTSKMVSVRESSNCENCMYLLNSWFFHITPEYELDPDFDKTLWGSGSGNFYGSGEGMPDEITVFEKPFAIDIYPTSHMLSSLFQDKYDKSHVNIGSSKGILKITTPDKNVFEFSGAPWYIYCDSEYGYVGHWESYEDFECKEGEYIINWLAEDIIKNQNIYLDATVKWDGYAWKILENKTWSEVSCSIPSSQNCNVNTNCECGITNCQKGWLRLKMPDKIELVKYFSGGEVSFNTGSTTGTATGYMDCLDDMKEYSLSIDVK